MKKEIAVMLCLGAGMWLVPSCTKEVGKPVVKTIDCDTITYTKHIAPIMTNSCVSCHNDSRHENGVNLTTYQGANATRLNGTLENVIFKGVPEYMPQGGPQLTDSQKSEIRCWIDNGGKK